MKVVVSDEAREWARAHGGVLFVRANRHRCCSGTTVMLETASEAPADAGGFVQVASDDIDVRFSGRASDHPKELSIEMRGRRRRRPVAYYDGCAYKI